ncbi:cobalt-precorrin 5A hydrolase [Clostridium tepidiprofundi]|nr:cobalt-precorrin 5A hydrolase [Clostridium tepidiprofundi]
MNIGDNTKLAIISVTNNGDRIAHKISNYYDADIYSRMYIKKNGIKKIVAKAFKKYRGIIFIASTGIAIRAIAPFLKNKREDPAVISIDNSGKYVISLVSGHLGGANELSLKIANIIDAEPIITTATDNLGIIAPDIIAKNNGLIIDDFRICKHIASLLVYGKKVLFIDEDEIIRLPVGYVGRFKYDGCDYGKCEYNNNRYIHNNGECIDYKNEYKDKNKDKNREYVDKNNEYDYVYEDNKCVYNYYGKIEGVVLITNKLNTNDVLVREIGNMHIGTNIPILKLIRRNIVLGIGCRKNYDSLKMKENVLLELEKYNIDKKAVNIISTIEIKKDEKAIIELANYLKCSINIFTVNEVKNVHKNYIGSDFVERAIGVRAVCEPCVELTNAHLLTGKIKCDGMTLCLGKIKSKRFKEIL